MHNNLPFITAVDRPSPREETSARTPVGWWASVQIALIALTPVPALLPQADGAMLIAPIAPGDRNATIRWAIDAGAKPLSPGPYAGSYVVQGSFGALVAPGLLHGALILNAASLVAAPQTRGQQNEDD